MTTVQEFSLQEKEYLHKAADLIEQAGICAGEFEKNGCYCAVGALGEVIAGEPALIDLPTARDEPELMFNRGEITGLFYKINARLGADATIWNDNMVDRHGAFKANIAIVAQLRIWAAE